MEHEPAENPPVVWVSQVATKGKPRLALSECPVSYISGESYALLEDFVAHQLIPGSQELAQWPARRVEAFAILSSELREMENHRDAGE